MTELPALGLHLSAHLDSRRAVDLAVQGETVGLHSVWLAEDLFLRGAFARAGAIAAMTSRIRIAIGVLTPYVRHPAVAAMEIASLRELAGDRVICGYGAGVRARTDHLGEAYVSPVEVVHETVRSLRTLLAGESLDADGLTHRAHALRLDVPPGSLPIYVAAMGPRALRQAGAIADGVILTLMASLPHLRWAVEQVRTGALEAGRATPPIVAYVAGAIDDDEPVAIERLRPFVARYVLRWEPITSLRTLFLESGVLGSEELHHVAHCLVDGASPDDVIPDDLVRAHAIVGTSNTARRRLQELSAIGVDVVALEPGPDEAMQGALIDALRHLAGSADV